jgi:hypothetical protein
MRRTPPRSRLCLLGLLILLATAVAEGAGQQGPRILALGNSRFLDAASVLAGTGAELVQDPGDASLTGFAVIVLANVAFASLPAEVQQGLHDYVATGGAVWLTGGAQGFGSGGYQPVANILPFALRSTSDWRPIRFRPTVVLQPGHPVVAGVEFGLVGAVNDMSPRSGSLETT